MSDKLSSSQQGPEHEKTSQIGERSGIVFNNVVKAKYFRKVEFISHILLVQYSQYSIKLMSPNKKKPVTASARINAQVKV